MVGWASLSIDGKTVIELCYARMSGIVAIAFSITENRKKSKICILLPRPDVDESESKLK